MSKYGSGLSSVDVCKLELKEMEEVLNKYNVSAEDKENLEGMLKEAYFQLGKSYASGRVMERHLPHEFKLSEYMQELMEEEQKYPFNIEEKEN